MKTYFAICLITLLVYSNKAKFYLASFYKAFVIDTDLNLVF